MKAKKPKPPVSPPAARKKRKTRPKGKASPESQAVAEISPLREFPRLSSQNIAKILNGFLVLRSTVKELSQSLQKVENMMDSALSIFDVASKFNRQGFRFPQSPQFLPLPSGEDEKSAKLEDSDIPVIRPPEEPEAPMFPNPSFMRNIPLGQILALMQSPLVWRWLSELLKARNSSAQLQRKQG